MQETETHRSDNHQANGGEWLWLVVIAVLGSLGYALFALHLPFSIPSCFCAVAYLALSPLFTEPVDEGETGGIWYRQTDNNNLSSAMELARNVLCVKNSIASACINMWEALRT